MRSNRCWGCRNQRRRNHSHYCKLAASRPWCAVRTFDPRPGVRVSAARSSSQLLRNSIPMSAILILNARSAILTLRFAFPDDHPELRRHRHSEVGLVDFRRELAMSGRRLSHGSAINSDVIWVARSLKYFKASRNTSNPVSGRLSAPLFTVRVNRCRSSQFTLPRFHTPGLRFSVVGLRFQCKRCCPLSAGTMARYLFD